MHHKYKRADIYLFLLSRPCSQYCSIHRIPRHLFFAHSWQIHMNLN